jgi:DnaK suppressor protein
MTTHAITTPNRARTSTTTPVAERLQHIEAARTQQLESLPEANLDAVATAYRDSIVRILEEVRTARRRVDAGLYSVCADCSGAVGEERLELRPWATTCATCARRSRDRH